VALSSLDHSRPVQIKLINSSTNVLNNVMLEGQGFDVEFSELKPASFLSFHVHPKGESGAKLTFTADSKKYENDDVGYMEPSFGYYLTITIQSNLETKTEVEFDQ
jgi:hypothetical protein